MIPASDTGAKKPARDVFLDALERPCLERAMFIETACAGDARLLAEVEDLLREHDRVGDFLETPVLRDPTASGTVLIPPGTVAVREKAGDRIGRYKLLQTIGEGGCGVVYMAEQEEPVRRRAALKIIKLGMDTKSVVARFEAERQALAMMDHPNIAKVFDGGATETGRPYFVMELVRGVRITDYCDENNLTTEERLELFIQVCQAIQHAHQKGVIHRDIKPSNILVTLHDGVAIPKVIDFGIAKATEQRLTDKTLFTEFQSFIGTPAYMSPEQAEMSGLDIDTRSDIYALGVLLYEMLTGTTPFDARELMSLGLDGARKTIREQEPARPSTRVATMVNAELTATAERRRTEPPKLIHSLRGDLDWIVMKCIEKDRTRRYATAHDLAEDVQRYLDGDTVLARPPSNIYRLRKFLRRHQGVVAAAAAIAITLVGGITASIWQAVRATDAEHLAETGREREIRLRRQAERESAAARLNEYVADINLAQQSLAAGNYGRAVQLLNKHRPARDETDLRGFEWRYLWQLTRGDAHVDFPSSDEPVQAVALSPSGEWLAVGSEHELKIWNAHTKALVISRSHGATGLAFARNGKWLVAASPGSGPMRGFGGGGAIQVLNTDDWSEAKKLSGTFGSLSLSADGQRLATFSRDGIHVWNTEDWSPVQTIRGASYPFSLSPDGKRLAADSRAGLAVWDIESGDAEVLLRDSTNLFAISRSARALAFSPDGKEIVASRNVLSHRGVFVAGIWDAETGAEIGVLPKDADPEHPEHTGGITAMAFSPDGRMLATASLDYSIRLWDFKNRQRIDTLQGNLNEVWCIAFSADGESIVSGARDGGVKLWPARPVRIEEELSGARLPLGFSTNSTVLATLSRTNTVVFFNLESGSKEEEFILDWARGSGGPGGPGGPIMMNFRSPPPTVSADLRTLATAGTNATIKIWDTEAHDAITLQTPDRVVAMLALSPDGRTLLSAGWQNGLRWWDLRHGTNCLLETECSRALFSADSRTLAMFGRDGHVEIWDAPSHTLRTNFVVESAPVFGASGVPVGLSPDGQVLAIAGQDDLITLWDVRTAQPTGTLVGHKQAVFSVAFSPDGKTLASASDDSTLKFWNITTLQELLTIRRLGGGLRALTFSRDGRYLVAGTSSTLLSGGVRIFRAPTLRDIERSEASVR
jgi:WD40 repeat protein/serine/threonine protein kinase